MQNCYYITSLCSTYCYTSNLSNIDHTILLNFRKQHCQSIHDLLLLCQRIENQMKKKPLMSKLKPKFYLIGSVAEGTRLVCGSEADLTLQFEGLHVFIVGKDATTIHVFDHDDLLLLHDYIKEENIFDYPKFLNFFLYDLHNALKVLSNMKQIPSSFKVNLDHVFCDKCYYTSEKKQFTIYKAMIHCKDCHPTICHTKLGACLVLPWNFENSKWIMTADLIPVFKVKGNTLGHFNKVIRTLVENNPPGWIEYIEKMFERDIIQPEAFSMQSTEICESFVGLKLLNYGDDSNFIIQPAQEMEVQDFQTNEILHEAYIHLKALNTVLDVGVKSYMLKKILLLPDFKKTSWKRIEDNALWGQTYEDERMMRECWQELVYDVTHHPDLRPRFEKKIDFRRWQKRSDNWRYLWAHEIPLKPDFLQNFIIYSTLVNHFICDMFHAKYVLKLIQEQAKIDLVEAGVIHHCVFLMACLQNGEKPSSQAALFSLLRLLPILLKKYLVLPKATLFLFQFMGIVNPAIKRQINHQG